MRYYSALLVGAVVAALLVVLAVSRNTPTIADTVSSPATCPAPGLPLTAPISVIEEIDLEGNVVNCYESQDVRFGPVGIVAFVTLDGRRLFLEHGQWRIRP